MGLGEIFSVVAGRGKAGASGMKAAGSGDCDGGDGGLLGFTMEKN